jgi:hypothetical protein
VRKSLVLLPQWPSAETIFHRPGQGVRQILVGGGRGVWAKAVFSLCLGLALMTVVPTFLFLNPKTYETLVYPRTRLH